VPAVPDVDGAAATHRRMSGDGSSDANAEVRSAAGGRARDIVRVVLVVLAVALGAAAISRDVDGFMDSLGAIGHWGALLAFFLTLCGLLLSAEAWRLNVCSLVGAIHRGAARRVFFVSQLGKYLPGAVWPVLAQVDAARRLRLSGSRMAMAALFFLALHLLTGLIVVAGVLPWAAPGVLFAYPWVLLPVPLLVVALVPPVLQRLVDLGLRILRRPPLPGRLQRRDVVPPSLWLMATWLAYGLGTLAVTAPLAANGVSVPLVAVSFGGFAMAWVVGLLVLPAPAGIGAREVVFVLALSPLLGVTEATSVAIVLRVVHTAGDLVLAAVGRWGRLDEPG
jgi:glycosyltransferase 2 family protein